MKILRLELTSSFRKLSAIVLVLIFTTCVLSFSATAQITISDYTFSTNNTSSLYDMTSAEEIIGPNQANVTSDNIQMPFPFGFAGTVHFTLQISTSGVISLSSTNSNDRYYSFYAFAVEGNTSVPNNPDAMGTGSNGNVSVKAFGAAPLRKFVIQFYNMSLDRKTGDNNATFQVAIQESTGSIEFVYGNMATDVTLNSGNGTIRPALGYQFGNKYFVVNTVTHTASISNNVQTDGYPSGIITTLNATGPTQCRKYIFTPPPVPNFSNTTMSFPQITSGSAAYNITLPASGLSNFILDSIENFSTRFNLANQDLVAGNNGTHSKAGMSPTDEIFLRAYATNGGAISQNYAAGSYFRLPSQSFTSTRNGSWFDNSMWGTAGGVLPTPGDSVIIRAGDTVAISNGGIFLSACKHLVIRGVLDFAESGIELGVTGNLTVEAGAKLLAHDFRLRGGNINQVQGKTVLVQGSIFGPGLLDFRFQRAKLVLADGVNMIANRIVAAPFETISGTPVLRNLQYRTKNPTSFNTPVTLVERIDAEQGSIITNGNVGMDNRFTIGFPPVEAIAIYRFDPATPAFIGTIQHGVGADYRVSLNYLGTRRILSESFSANAPRYLAGAEVPQNGTLNKVLVQTNTGVEFAQPIKIRQELELEGNIYMGNNSLDFTFYDGGNSGGTGNLFFKAGGINTTGEIIKHGVGGLFPILYNGLNRFFTTGAFFDNQNEFAVKYVHEDGNTNFATPYTENGINFTARTNAHWQVRNEAGVSIYANADLNLRAGNFPNVGNFTKFGISKENTAVAGTAANAVFGNKDFQVKKTGLNPGDITGNFYLGFEAATALPVTLLSFDASKRGQQSLLQWVTSSEQNNKGFNVQRSYNGTQFSTIGFVAAAGNGNSSGTNNYNYIDASVQKGNNYYRLQQLDKDNGIKYSDIEVLNFITVENFTVGPVPTKDFVIIKSADLLSTIDKTIMKLIDASGKVLKTELLLTNGQKFNLSGYGAGVYYLQIATDKETITKQILKL